MTQNTLVAPPSAPPLAPFKPPTPPPFAPPSPPVLSVTAKTFVKELNGKFLEGKVLPSEIGMTFDEPKFLELNE